MKHQSNFSEIETEIDTLKNQIKEKIVELDNAIEQGMIFEKTRKLYLEMKALKERLNQQLQGRI